MPHYFSKNEEKQHSWSLDGKIIAMSHSKKILYDLQQNSPNIA